MASQMLKPKELFYQDFLLPCLTLGSPSSCPKYCSLQAKGQELGSARGRGVHLTTLPCSFGTFLQ